MSDDVEHPTPGELKDNVDSMEVDESRDESAKLEALRQIRLGEKNYVTGRIGETCRFIGFGVLAIFYTVLTSDKPFAQDIVTNHGIALYLTGLTGATAIFSDYLQYLCGAFAVEKALSREDGKLHYKKSWFSYKLRRIFYWTKQISALVASGSVVYIVLFQFIVLS